MFNIYKTKTFAVIALLFLFVVMWEHKSSVRKDFPDPAKTHSSSSPVGARHTIEFDIDKPKSQYSMWDKIIAYFLADEIKAARAKKVGYVNEQQRRFISKGDIVQVSIIDIEDSTAKAQEKTFEIGKSQTEEWIENAVMQHRVGDQMMVEHDGTKYQITVTAITRKDND